jgi:hypothetical protein
VPGVAEQFCWFADMGATKMLEFQNHKACKRQRKAQKSLYFQGE